jgi:hypothetical protein
LEKGGREEFLARPFQSTKLLQFLNPYGSKIDEFVKNHSYSVFVIPAEAEIQLNQAFLGSRLRGSDGFFDFCEIIMIYRGQKRDGVHPFHPNDAFLRLPLK